jgi:hypothetical protein
MNDAYVEYGEIGKAHTQKRLSDKGLAQAIRKTVVPRLLAARGKLDQIRPQSEYERRKIEVNKRLFGALIAQVSAMANFADTRQPRFAQELAQHAAQAEAASQELLKLESMRKPAGLAP